MIQKMNPGQPAGGDLNSGASVFQTATKALKGDSQSADMLMLGAIPCDPVPSAYYAVVASQNGSKDLRLPVLLYWSGNVFNQVRAGYWFTKIEANIVESVLFDGRVISEKAKVEGRSLLGKEGAGPKIGQALAKMHLNSVEADVLKKNMVDALLGSQACAVNLWKFYLLKIKEEGVSEFSGGFDWIAVCRLNLEGFPGARTCDKIMYWTMIGAENGDPESQFRLAGYHSDDHYLSTVRRRFWLGKAAEQGFSLAKKQLSEDGPGR